jgi:hypothetical protein
MKAVICKSQSYIVTNMRVSGFAFMPVFYKTQNWKCRFIQIIYMSKIDTSYNDAFEILK